MVHERGSSGKEELLLLACDGVWDVFDDQDAGEFLISRLDGPLREVSSGWGRGEAWAGWEGGVGGSSVQCPTPLEKRVRNYQHGGGGVGGGVRVGWNGGGWFFVRC